MSIPRGLGPSAHDWTMPLSACTLRQPARPVEAFCHRTCLEVLPLLRSALDHTCNHKPRFVANPGEKEADARGLLRFLPVHRVYSANGSWNSRFMHPRCPLTAASRISVSLGTTRIVSSEGLSSTGMRGNIIPLFAVARCWNKCGLAQLETPTQTTPDWETRPESQKPLVPEPFCADDVCGGRTTSTPLPPLTGTACAA